MRNPLPEPRFPWMGELSDETLAEAWCSLNASGWHPCIPGEPEAVPQPYVPGFAASSRRWAIMSAILSRIGRKECLRHWNTRGLHPHMTNDAFEEWWRTRDAPGSSF